MGLCLNRISRRLLCLILLGVLWAQFSSILGEIAAELLGRLHFTATTLYGQRTSAH